MRKERKQFTPEEKGAILKRHLVDKARGSELYQELGGHFGHCARRARSKTAHSVQYSGCRPQRRSPRSTIVIVMS